MSLMRFTPGTHHGACLAATMAVALRSAENTMQRALEDPERGAIGDGGERVAEAPVRVARGLLNPREALALGRGAKRVPHRRHEGGERQREMAIRFGVNIAMYALTGNYKADQVHVPDILERLGQ